MVRNSGRYYVDWWSVRKSSIYLILGGVFLLALAGGAVWWFWGSNFSVSNVSSINAPKDSATIVSFEGTVRIIRSETNTTERVTKTTYLQAGDTVQTQADGRAQIKMIDGSTLSVRPNSTVVISDSSSILGGTSVRVKLDDGQINVVTEEQPKLSNNIVEIKESENKLLSESEASFHINETTNQGEIRINRGGVESKIGGETYSVKEKEFIAISKGKLASREQLLNPPVLASPSPSQQIRLSQASKVLFTWSTDYSSGKPQYEMELATSPFFVEGKMMAENRGLKKPSATINGLTPGTYFWRVRAQAPSGQTSDWSEPSKFRIVKKSANAEATASNWRVENVGGNVYIVRGTTKPGATVRIHGRETFANSKGQFRLQVKSSAPTVGVDIIEENGAQNQYSISLRTGRVLN